MPRRPTRGPRPVPARSPTAGRATDPDALLDALETATLANDRDQVAALSAELWAARRQMPDALVSRVVDGRARLPGLAMDLLRGLAGTRAPAYLRRIAENTAAPDIVRFGAQRRAGWPERGQAKRRRAFLETLADPSEMLVEATRQGTGGVLPDSEVLGEVLGYLVALTREQRAEVVRRIVAEVGSAAAWLLRSLLHVPDASLQRYVLAQLVRLRDVGAAGALTRLAQTARGAALRAEARAAVQRLQLRPAGQDDPSAAQQLPPLARAYLSLIDGDGGQVAIVVREWLPGAYLFADVFHNEVSGIKHVLGITRADATELEEMLEGFAAQDLALVEVDLDATRGALAAAAAVNAEQGRPFPPELELWEPYYHDLQPPPADESVVAPELDDAPYATRADLVRASGRLAEHSWFASWGFDAEDLLAAMAVAPRPAGIQLTDKQYRPLIAALFGEEPRARWRRRLRRQAWLLDRAGEPQARDWALATAAQLATADAAALAKNPFVRQLVERNVLQLTMATLLGMGPY